MHSGPDDGARAARRQRVLLSVFFVLHWGAIAAYLLPASEAALEPLPAPLRAPAAAVVPGAVRRIWPLAEPYLDLTGTRQHWSLFAPAPADWVSSVRVVPYFAESPTGGTWRADTIVVRGALDVPYPHLLRHRTYRILFNLGYEDWGASYRPTFARELCRTLRDARGRGPDGVALWAVWEPIALPWDDRVPGAYRQWMGGFDCVGAQEARAPWPAYGLPAVVDTEGWPLVVEEFASSPAGGGQP